MNNNNKSNSIKLYKKHNLKCKIVNKNNIITRKRSFIYWRISYDGSEKNYCIFIL